MSTAIGSLRLASARLGSPRLPSAPLSSPSPSVPPQPPPAPVGPPPPGHPPGPPGAPLVVRERSAVRCAPAWPGLGVDGPPRAARRGRARSRIANTAGKCTFCLDKRNRHAISIFKNTSFQCPVSHMAAGLCLARVKLTPVILVLAWRCL